MCLLHMSSLSVQSVWFEKGMEGGSVQSLHLWGVAIHELSTPVSSTAVNTRVKIDGVPL